MTFRGPLEDRLAIRERYDAYSDVMAHFIRDVRKDLQAPELPFVIGVLGVGGPVEEQSGWCLARPQLRLDPDREQRGGFGHPERHRIDAAADRHGDLPRQRQRLLQHRHLGLPHADAVRQLGSSTSLSLSRA